MEWIRFKDVKPARRQRVLVSSEDGYFMQVLFYFGDGEWSVSENIMPSDIYWWSILVMPPKD